jgi:DNA-binding transcriptional MerR regulator
MLIDKMNDQELATITELAEALGMTPRAIRFYESKGLILPQRVGANRVYNHRDRGRLKLIQRAKRLGFSLEDIREYLDLYDADPVQIEQQQLLLSKVKVRIAELEQQQIDLATTLEELREIARQTETYLGETESQNYE